MRLGLCIPGDSMRRGPHAARDRHRGLAGGAARAGRDPAEIEMIFSPPTLSGARSHFRG